MPAPLSIVIPTLNAAASLPRCAEALIEGLPTGLVRELIISDGGSDDATIAIAEEAGAVLLRGAPSRGGQLRRGVEAARGEWLLILHADTILPVGWSDHVAAHLRDGTGPAHFRLAFAASGLMPALVAGWANLRSTLFGLPYGDQGLLIRRSDYERCGGYPDQPLMEDVALVRALARSGRRMTVLPVAAVTDAERYIRAGWLRRGARNLWTLARYFAGVDPACLDRGYRR